MRVPIFLNKAVGLRNENATFLHNFALLYLHIIRKWLTICVFAGLTRNLILRLRNEMFRSDCSIKVSDRMGCRVKPGRTRGSKIPPIVPR